MPNIFKQKILLVFSALSAFLFLLSLVLIYFNLSRLSAPLILHFDALRGVDFFGEKYDFFGIWLVGLAAAIINTILSEIFFYRERILSYIFSGVNLLLALLILIFVAVVIRVN